MSRRPGLKTYKNTEDTIKNDKEDKDGIPWELINLRQNNSVFLIFSFPCICGEN